MGSEGVEIIMAQKTMDPKAITDALAPELENDENVVVLVKMLGKTEEFSGQLKDCRKNSEKTEYSILL